MGMGTFESDKQLNGNPKYISKIADKICQTFANDGFETKSEHLATGGYDISLSKGGLFKAILGMKSALKVSIVPKDGGIYIKAGIGIFGQQAIPIAISMLILWPVLIAQIWGMVQQSKLDDKAIIIAEEELNRLVLEEKSNMLRQEADVKTNNGPQYNFCGNCGEKLPDGAKFCTSCGTKLF